MKIKEKAFDVLIEVLKCIGVIAGSFLWWLAVFAIFSIILMNIWITSWEEILHLTELFGGITALILIVRMIRKDYFKS